MAFTFTCTWMNRLDQFASTDFDLLVVNDDGVIPDCRVSKNYPTSIVTAAFLEDEANNEVARIIDQWNEENA